MNGPHHPIVKATADQWHKIAAILMHKFKTDHEVITVEDLRGLEDGTKTIVIQELSDGLHIRFVDNETANRILRQAQAGGPIRRRSIGRTILMAILWMALGAILMAVMIVALLHLAP